MKEGISKIEKKIDSIKNEELKKSLKKDIEQKKQNVTLK